MKVIRICPGGLACLLAAILFPISGAAQILIPPTNYTVNGGFTVNTASREQTRCFYNAIYPTSDNVAINSTSDPVNCFPGENSQDFLNAVLRRLNWFRAMAGVP